MAQSLVGAAIMLSAGYLLYQFAVKPAPDSKEDNWAAQQRLQSVPTSTDIADAADLWRTNPRVMFYTNPFLSPQPVTDSRLSPPMAAAQSVNNMQQNPGLSGRASSHGGVAADTGTRQEAPTTKSVEQATGSVASLVFKDESKTLNDDDLKRQMTDRFDKWSESVRSGKSHGYEEGIATF